jgi:hypothetical protein
MALARPPSQTSSSSPDGWHGYKYWLANVPYPNGNDSFENPSVLASDDAAFWQIPAGGTNPLVSAPPCDHNNDPDLVYNPATDELWLYYLDTRRSSRCGASYNDNYLKLIKSSDGVHWSEPLTLIDWPLATNPLYVSPTITVVNGTLYLWAVNSATFTMRTASSSDGMHFGPSSGLNIANLAWHVDVEYVPSKSE